MVTWIWVNIVSGKGRHEAITWSMLISHYWSSVAFTCEQFHNEWYTFKSKWVYILHKDKKVVPRHQHSLMECIVSRHCKMYLLQNFQICPVFWLTYGWPQEQYELYVERQSKETTWSTCVCVCESINKSINVSVTQSTCFLSRARYLHWVKPSD